VRTRLLLSVVSVCAVAALAGACGSTTSTVTEASGADTELLVQPAGTTSVDTEPSLPPKDGASVDVDTEPAYDEREVRFRQPVAGFELAGTLTIPAGSGPFPGVVLISGSGTQDRNETIGTHQPFLDLADGLARRGIVVLRFDDRGAGDSGGEPVELSDATTLDNAQDALAAVDFLADQPQVATGRLGVIGHSEGGWIGPIVANDSDKVTFAVLLAGSGVPGADVLERQVADLARDQGATPDIVDWQVGFVRELIEVSRTENDPAIAEAAMRQVLDAAAAAAPPGALPADPAAAIDEIIDNYNRPWMKFFIAYDPAPDLRALQIPVMAIFAELDLQASAEVNAPATQAALQDNPDATVLVVDGLDHLFQSATGPPDQPFDADTITLIADWIQ
jgi:dienelactone hydrolase